MLVIPTMNPQTERYIICMRLHVSHKYINSNVIRSQIPNGLGAVYGLAQLILYAAYYKSTQRLIAERKGKELSFSKVIIDDDEPKKSSCAACATQNGREPGNHHAT